MINKHWVVAVSLLGIASVASCSNGPATTGLPPGTPFGGSSGAAGSSGSGGTGGSAPTGASIGASCVVIADCRAGLFCNAGKCAASHLIAAGSPCAISDECAANLQCVAGSCAPAGAGMANAACKSDLDCAAGLRCSLDGLSLSCQPQGKVDIGGTCSSSSDCYAGLGCAAGSCAVVPPGAVFGTPWAGVECSAPSTTTVRAYFEVPGAANAQEADFFRLPFPNDARRASDGKLDLSGFPTPGAGLLGFDPVQIYADAITASDKAWGAYPTVTFRFSGAVDWNTVKLNLSDVTPGLAAGEGDSGWWSSYYSTSRTAYVCDNWVAIMRGHGKPLQPGHTYAFWMAGGVKTPAGVAVERSENLQSLLADSAPTDSALSNAYTAYKPFRDFIKAGSKDAPQSASDVTNVSVVTVGAIRDPMQALAAAAAKETLPLTKSWVKCAAGVKSPCPQADGDRACGAANSAFDEYHALVSLPRFQQGTEPYLTPADGGGIQIKSPAPREDVCLALTIPKAAKMPAAGWPIVIFAHGTGGSFRSHVTDDTAGVLAKSPTPFAVIGIDQVEHGTRRGKSTESPNNLFFNFANPQSARGNPLQGAADQLGLVRLVSAFSLSALQTGGAAIKLDKDNIVFFGHSQGSTEGSLAMPYADGVKAAVLSGNGAALKYALLNKTNPVNIAGALPFALQDPALADPNEAPELHPVLSLLQQWIDPADPLHFATSITRSPITGHTPKHVFQPYGLGDTYAPPLTLREYAQAGQLDVVASDASVPTPDVIFDGVTPLAAGASGNVTIATKKYTLGVREYTPPLNTDGHFVAFDNATANADVVRFLSGAVGGAVPAIGK